MSLTELNFKEQKLNDINNKKIPKKAQLVLKILSICFLAVFFISSITIKNDNLYSAIMQNSLSLVIAIAVFNIGALYALLQINYYKFNSTKLIIEILKSKVLILLTAFPFLILCLNFFFLNPCNKYNFLPTTIILISFLSPLLLIVYFKKYLETNEVIKNILKKTNEQDFLMYKQNYVYLKETNIDAILHISLSIIRNKDIARGHTLFYLLALWTNKNIKYIKYSDNSYESETQSKFIDFYNAICDELFVSKNEILNKYFVNAFNYMDINSENFHDYRIIYDVFYKHLLKSLENKEENFAIDIYSFIYKNSAKILLNIQKARKHSNIDENIWKFKEIFTSYNRMKFIDAAIENGCDNFLEDINLFNDLFILPGFEYEESYKKWDNRVILNIFIDLRFYVAKKCVYLIEKGNYVFFLKRKYEMFFKRYHYGNIKNVYEDELTKFVFTNVEYIYKKAISAGKINDWNDFDLIWNTINSSIENENLVNFKLFYTFYTYLLDLTLEKAFSIANINKESVYDLWSKNLQIIEIIKTKLDGVMQTLFINVFEEKTNFLRKKYSKLEHYEIYENIGFKNRFIPKIDLLKEYNINLQCVDNENL